MNVTRNGKYNYVEFFWLFIHIQFITRFQAIAPLLGDVYDGSCYDDAVQYNCMIELVYNIN